MEEGATKVVKDVPKNKLKKLLVVVGATGTGKSKLAIDLAKKFNGEVLNADSMQMYKV